MYVIFTQNCTIPSSLTNFTLSITELSGLTVILEFGRKIQKFIKSTNIICTKILIFLSRTMIYNLFMLLSLPAISPFSLWSMGSITWRWHLVGWLCATKPDLKLTYYSKPDLDTGLFKLPGISQFLDFSTK